MEPAVAATAHPTIVDATAANRIRVENPVGAGRGVSSVTVDGQPEPGGKVPLQDDGQAHDVRVVLG